jgi:hypothetical protein
MTGVSTRRSIDWLGMRSPELDPIDVAWRADDAVAVVAGEIGVDERGGDAARFFGLAANAGENLGAEVPQRAGGNMNRHVQRQ